MDICLSSGADFEEEDNQISVDVGDYGNEVAHIETVPGRRMMRRKSSNLTMALAPTERPSVPPLAIILAPTLLPSEDFKEDSQEDSHQTSSRLEIEVDNGGGGPDANASELTNTAPAVSSKERRPNLVQKALGLFLPPQKSLNLSSKHQSMSFDYSNVYDVPDESNV